MNLAQFILILGSVLGVFLVMGIGAFCRARHWLTREADVSLAKITANVLVPALFVDRILNDESLSSLSDAWVLPAFGFGFTAGGCMLAWLVARTIGPWAGLKTDLQQRAFAVCAGICNYGYIPIPLAQIFYPDAEVDLILHNVGVDLALWSVGVAIVSGGDPNQRKLANKQSFATSVWRWLQPVVTSGPLIAVAFALAVRSVSVESLIPAAVMRPIAMLASTAIPMGLLLSGAIIIDFVKVSKWNGAVPVIAMAISFRQMLMPLLMLTAAGTIVSQVETKQVLLLQAAMSSAVFPIVLVRMYHGDTTTALRVVLSTSMIALLTIPIWMAAGGWFLGIEVN